MLVSGPIGAKFIIAPFVKTTALSSFIVVAVSAVTAASTGIPVPVAMSPTVIPPAGLSFRIFISTPVLTVWSPSTVAVAKFNSKSDLLVALTL